jgi:hypothetical protein
VPDYYVQGQVQGSNFIYREVRCDRFISRIPATYKLRPSTTLQQHTCQIFTCHPSGKTPIITEFRILLLLLLLLLLTAIELSSGGSSPYTSTDKTNKNKYT